MSKYTTEVRFLCESLSGNMEQQGFSKLDDILTTSAPLIFDFDFPIFDEDYRLGLEKKILRHFYTREISEETVALWKLRLQDKLCTIMPYYNQLYESELLEFEPFGDIELTTTGNKSGSGAVNGSSSENGKTEYSESSAESGETGNTRTTSETVTGTDKTVVDGTETTSGSDSKSYTNGISTTVTTDDDTTVKKTGNNSTKDVVAADTTETTSGSGTNNTTDAYSDTPQGSLSNVADLAYLTNARVTDNDTTNKSTVTTDYDATDTKTDTISESQVTDGSVTQKTTHSGTDTTSGTTSGSKDVDSTTTLTKSDSTSGSVNDSGTSSSEGSKSSTTTSSNSGTTGQTSNSTEEYVEKIAGKRSLSSFSKYLVEFRQTFLNIDEMVMNELNDLFIKLW